MTDLIDRLRDDARSEWAICNEAAEALERMALELSNARAVDIHSCHAGCTRAGCVNARLREESERQTATIAGLRESAEMAVRYHAAELADVVAERNAIEEQAVKNADEVLALRAEREALQDWVKDTGDHIMTPEDLATYRANYDRVAWERITQGWRLHVVPPGAILAINALCDEVERLQRELSTN